MNTDVPLRDRIAQVEQELQSYESTYRRIDVAEDPARPNRVERELLEESGGVQEQVTADFLLGKFNRTNGNESGYHPGLPEQPSGSLHAELYCWEALPTSQQSESLAPDSAGSAQRGYWRNLSPHCGENSSSWEEVELGRKRQASSTTDKKRDGRGEKEERDRRSLSRTRDPSKEQCRDEIEVSSSEGEEDAPRKRRRRGK